MEDEEFRRGSTAAGALAGEAEVASLDSGVWAAAVKVA